MLGDRVQLPDRFVKNAITLNSNLPSDDRSVYMYSALGACYKGFGCGAGKLNSHMKSFSKTELIPNTEATRFFEAPIVFKRNAVSTSLSCERCEDASYGVGLRHSQSPLGLTPTRKLSLKTNANRTFMVRDTTSVLQEKATTYYGDLVVDGGFPHGVP